MIASLLRTTRRLRASPPVPRPVPGRRQLLALGLLLPLAVACSEAPEPSVAWSPEELAFFTAQAPDPAVRHVHLMHLDGFHPGLFEALLSAGQLPHFAFLLERGKLSTRAATVDKSETFKVIQAYLTSRLDTRVVGWWQFSREELGFRNFWLDPVQVAAYALGLEFPVHPTIFDVVAARGGAVAAGFSLHRRSVPFANYSRNYLEGARAAFDHSYFTQAHATMDSFLAILERMARSERERPPALSMSLLAVADEFGHLDGIVQPRGAGDQDAGVACFERRPPPQRAEDPIEGLYQTLDEERGSIRRLYRRGGYFTRLEHLNGKTRRICIRVPAFETAAWPAPTGELGATTREHAAPRVVLGMIQADIELGRLIDRLRAIRFDAEGRRRFEPEAGNGIAAYVEAGRPEGSLFERTLFILLGDHGMVHTAHKMTPVDPEHPDPRRHPDSLDVDLLAYLNGALGLETPSRDSATAPGVALGIDDQHLPLELATPHLDPSWQGAAVRGLVADSEAWSAAFFGEVKEVLRGELYTRYWWLLWLRKLLVDPNLDARVDPYRERAVVEITKLHLRGEPAYLSAERQALGRFYDRHVRLVYGGGARNNAELFLPSRRDGDPSWATRPSFEEITTGRGAALLRALEALPAVGLVFVREANDSLVPGRPLPESLRIQVRDRAGHAGTITVRRDGGTGVLLFHYRVAPGSRADPLGYGELGRGDGTWGTYAEWNDRSVAAQHAYHNAVAGMGAHLYSTSPSIGDVTLMHAQGWNFGGNSGGHGGLHREEKLTVMMVSGPGIERGELMAHARHASSGARVVARPSLTHPTVLDAAPTALAWLGFGETALEDFARRGFDGHLDGWVGAQRADLLGNLDEVENLNQALREAGFDELRISRFRDRLARLLAFLPQEAPQLLEERSAAVDGNLLKLD